MTRGSEPGTDAVIRTLCLSTFIVGLDTLVVAPLIPDMMAAAGQSASRGSLLVTAYAAASALGALFLGLLSDFAGRKRVINSGLALLAAGTAATAAASTFPLMLAARGLAGIGAALILPTIFALIGDLVPYESRGRAHGKAMGAMIFATVLGVPAGSLLAAAVGWRYSFLAIAVLILGILFHTNRMIGARLGAPSGRRVSLSSYFGQYGAVVTVPRILAALAAGFLWSGGFNAMFSNIGTFYRFRHGLDLNHVSLVFLAGGVATWLGSMAGGRLSDAWGKRTVVAVAALGCALCVAGLGLLPLGLMAAASLHVLWGAAMGMGAPAITALVSQLKPEARGLVMSLNSFSMQSGVVAGTAAAAWLMAGRGIPGVSILAAAVACLVPLFLVMVRLPAPNAAAGAFPKAGAFPVAGPIRTATTSKAD